jgi:hypothetical protein
MPHIRSRYYLITFPPVQNYVTDVLPFYNKLSDTALRRTEYLMVARASIFTIAQLHLTVQARRQQCVEWWRSKEDHRHGKLAVEGIKLLVGTFVVLYCGFVAVSAFRRLDIDFGFVSGILRSDVVQECLNDYDMKDSCTQAPVGETVLANFMSACRDAMGITSVDACVGYSPWDYIMAPMRFRLGGP